MIIKETHLEDCYIIKPNKFEDTRGWFMESYSEKWMKEKNLNYTFIQDNHSYTKSKNTIRGIHFQLKPHDQAKLVRCTRGKILDVAVDLRKNSKTYKKWYSIELSNENSLQLLIPKGFGHGFLTLTDDCEVQYKTDSFYNYDSDRSIKYDDKDLAIEWKVTNPNLSKKDSEAPYLNESDVNF